MSWQNALFTPGALVKHLDQPEWGIGQVQSNIAGKITVNFPETGKLIVYVTDPRLEYVGQPQREDDI